MTHEIRDPPLDQGTGQIGTGHEEVPGPRSKVKCPRSLDSRARAGRPWDGTRDGTRCFTEKSRENLARGRLSEVGRARRRAGRGVERGWPAGRDTLFQKGS